MSKLLPSKHLFFYRILPEYLILGRGVELLLIEYLIIYINNLFTGISCASSVSEEMSGSMYAEFPYIGEEMSMGIILPGSLGETGQLCQQINNDLYNKLVSSAFKERLIFQFLNSK